MSEKEDTELGNLTNFCCNEDQQESVLQHVRENFMTLVEYRERTGTLEPLLLKVKQGLFNEDPFVVLGSSIAASALLAERRLYH
jgi:hypothetical protein